MSSEAALRAIVKEKLSPFGKLERIEQKMGEGTPDILWLLSLPGWPAATGLMELKHVASFPKRSKTPFTIPSLTRAQADWARSWEEAGGMSPLLLQVGSTYCLFPGRFIGPLFLDAPRPWVQVLNYAAVTGNKVFPLTRILKVLVRREDYYPLHRYEIGGTV